MKSNCFQKNMKNLLNIKNSLIVVSILALFITPLFIKSPYYQDLLFMMFFYAVLAGAWNFIGGFAGQISLGHTAFFGIGAYTSTLLYLNLGLSPWLGMLAGALLAVLVGICIGTPCFRLKTHFFALSTIAFAEVLRLLSIYFRNLTNGTVGLQIPFKPGWQYLMFKDKIAYIYITLIFMLVVIFLSYIIKHSKIGYYLIALKEDQDAAESLGVKTSLYKLIALIISVFFVSIGGSLYSQYLLFIDPGTVFNFTYSVDMALFSIIGGVGTVLGPIAGAFILTPFDILLREWLGSDLFGLNFVIYGTILVVAVIYFPSGLVPWLEKMFKNRFRDLYGKPENDENRKVENRELLFISRYPKNDSKTESNIPLLQVKGLSKRFGGLKAVSEVTFEIRNGEILGLIGPNGAGKTTIFNLISGFLMPDKGSVTFKGKDITHLRMPHDVCSVGITRTFQIVKPFRNMTVLDNVMVGVFAKTQNKKFAEIKAKQFIDFVGLDKKIGYLAENLTIADRKRLELCRALATEPELLLLDEVMAGLNPKETEEIIDLVKEISKQGITLLVTEHIMQAIMTLSHRIVVVNNGEKIAEGTPEDISRNMKVIEAYLGEEYVAKCR